MLRSPVALGRMRIYLCRLIKRHEAGFSFTNYLIRRPRFLGCICFIFTGGSQANILIGFFPVKRTVIRACGDLTTVIDPLAFGECPAQGSHIGDGVDRRCAGRACEGKAQQQNQQGEKFGAR